MKYIVFILIGIGVVQANPSVKSIETEIEILEKAIADENLAWKEEKALEKKSEIKRQEQYDNLLKDQQAYTKSIVDIERSISGNIKELASKKSIESAKKSWLTSMLKRLLIVTKESEELLEKSFDFQKEKRIQGARLLKIDLESERISAEEAFNRLWDLYKNEIQLASDAEIFSGTIQGDKGNIVSVKYLRVGKQFFGYRSDDDLYVGVKTKNSSGDWVWFREFELDYDSRRAIRDAVATAEGKRPQSFVRVPIWLEGEE